MLGIVARYLAELGLPPPTPPAPPEDRFPEQLQAALGSGASALSFTFGKLPTEAVAAARERGRSSPRAESWTAAQPPGPLFSPSQ
jgi:nitronate monooxygenase